MDGYQDQEAQINQSIDQETQIISKYTDQHEMNYENQIMSKNNSDAKETQFNVKYTEQHELN
jgi:hypothetical protein